MNKKLVTMSLTAMSILGGMSAVSATPVVPEINESSPATNVQVEPLEVTKRVQLKVNAKYELASSNYRVVSGDTRYIGSSGNMVWFTAPGTYVLQVDGWFSDTEYVFNVTK
ncbi:hypothetical protein [Aneurinibacillus migulanus]|uniref:hypothetical protein n=1 Tax=Aneurinibacillus migulanus TaxID=47500 RepID=UPI000A8B2A04|nr:hypothetical protein [Aneurinibacillus migulanus]